MNKTTLIILSLAISFCFGFAFNSIIDQSNGKAKTKKVTGIGGIFFKCKDPKRMREWYETNLGLNTNQYGAVFEWWQGEDSTKKGFTQWSPFNEKTKYFEPSAKEFMINYRVENIASLVEEFKKNGVTVVDTIEPNDIEYEKLGKQMGTKTTK
jgi:catechol 2,3-dioxygenase-like lactoylglutathione lyase family enzyme